MESGNEKKNGRVEGYYRKRKKGGLEMGRIKALCLQSKGGREEIAASGGRGKRLLWDRKGNRRAERQT